MYNTIVENIQNFNGNIILGTDQNFDYIKIEQHKNIVELLSIFITNSLIPTITKPTRITHSTATLIDNIYVSTKTNTHICSAILCEDISDHLPIITCIGKIKSKPKKEPLIFKTRDMTNDKISKIANEIQIRNWNYLDNLDLNHAYKHFSDELSKIIDSNAPEKSITIPYKRVIRDPWMTKGLIKCANTLNKLHMKKIRKVKTHPDYIKYLQYRNTYNKTKRTSKLNYYDNLLQKYKYDVRKTWGVINNLIGKTNDKSNISETFQINGINTANQDIISNEFCSFFTNIGLKYAEEIPASKYNHDHYLKAKSKANMFMAPTDPNEIIKMINLLKRKNSSGHDNISSSFLKDIKAEIALPLTILFNKSLSEGTVPDAMKLAQVIPIFK